MGCTNSFQDLLQEPWLVQLPLDLLYLAIILQPMDMTKTQQQGYYHQATIQNGATGKQLQHIRWQVAAKNLYRDRGIIGFWDGLVHVSY